jgi:hypothetical protein
MKRESRGLPMIKGNRFPGDDGKLSSNQGWALEICLQREVSSGSLAGVVSPAWRMQGLEDFPGFWPQAWKTRRRSRRRAREAPGPN